jgi:hypothetical protein
MSQQPGSNLPLSDLDRITQCLTMVSRELQDAELRARSQNEE